METPDPKALPGPQALDEEAARQLARAAGAYFSRRRKVVEKTCLYCGKRMWGVAQRKYCSPTCCTADWQRRHKDVYLARRRERERRKRQQQREQEQQQEQEQEQQRAQAPGGGA